MSDFLKNLFDKIGGFFHIFDASYFISGFFATVVFAIIIPLDSNLYNWLINQSNISNFIIFKYELNIYTVLICSVFMYCIGLILYIIGRFIRIKYIQETEQLNDDCEVDYKILKAIVNYDLLTDFSSHSKAQDLDKKIKPYLDDFKLFRTLYDGNKASEDYAFFVERRTLYHYYTLCYSKLRLNKEHKEFVAHCDRKWVEMAMYDGFLALFTILGVYFLIKLIGPFEIITFLQLLASMIFSFVIARMFLKETVKKYGLLISDVLSAYIPQNSK